MSAIHLCLYNCIILQSSRGMPALRFLSVRLVNLAIHAQTQQQNMLQHGLNLHQSSMYMSLHNIQIWQGFFHISLFGCWAHSLGNTCSNLTRRCATECECNVPSLVTRECGD